MHNTEIGRVISIEKDYIMFFDTETTGLFPKNTRNIATFPYITQLCFIVYDVSTQSVVKCFNSYINIPQDILITPIVTELTGVTREKCDQGVSIMYALNEFYKAYMSVHSIIAHNLSFDLKMIKTEIERNRTTIMINNDEILFAFDGIYRKVNKYCTMEIGRPICNIIATKLSIDKTKQEEYIKNPKLNELYEKLFGKKFENQHNALYDTIACLRCFVMMFYNIKIPNKIVGIHP